MLKLHAEALCVFPGGVTTSYNLSIMVPERGKSFYVFLIENEGNVRVHGSHYFSNALLANPLIQTHIVRQGGLSQLGMGRANAFLAPKDSSALQ